MKLTPTFRLNTQRYFIPALRQYAMLSKRTPAEVCNKKAFFINRRAIWHTRKADFETMANELGQMITFKQRKFRGKKVLRPTSKGQGQFNSAKSAPAPLLALIINSRRGKKGLKGLRGEAMRKAFQKVFGARARSIAFIKSGFIEARDAFKNAAGGGGGRGLPPGEGTGIGGPKRIGQAKGGATIAKPQWRTRAIFWNTASTNRDRKQALYKFGIPAMQKAIDEEARDTAEEVVRRLRQNAKSIGIRVR